MKRNKIPNQKKKYKELESRIKNYTIELERIISILNEEAARLALTTEFPTDTEELFSFKNYPQTKYGIEQLQQRYVSDIGSLIYRGTSEEWKKSNLLSDLLADGVLKEYVGFVDREIHKQYYQTNSKVLKAFQSRKDRGLSLSKKLWNQSTLYLNELESAISVALERGTSAVTLSKQLSKYLKNFPSLQKDYKEKYGKAANIYDCEYNAARLARSEINIAYRTAEQTRWKQMDFVIGYEVKLSNNHNCKGVPKGKFYDICDELAGKYPKDFKFTGWHPMCRCYTVPILKTEDEFFGDLPGRNEIKDVPKQFRQWMDKNSARYERAKERGTLPYFVKDNEKYAENLANLKSNYELSDKTILDLERRGFKFVGFSDSVSASYNKSANGNVVLRFIGVDNNGEMFELQRDFIEIKNKRKVRHSYFVLPGHLQGKGISKSIFRELFSLYEDMGIDEVNLFANIYVGGYAWGKYGFSASKQDVYSILEKAYEKGIINKERYIELEKSINNVKGDKYPMNILAGAKDGKNILLGSEWYGSLYFKDTKQVEKAKKYIGF